MDTSVNIKYKEAVSCLNTSQMLVFLDGKMKGDEESLVEKHLTECDLCVEALENLHQNGMNKQADVLQFTDDFAQGLDQVSQSQSSPSRNNNWLKIAAAVLFLAVASVSWWVLAPSKSERIFNDSFSPYLNAQDISWMGTNTENQLESALAAYNNQDYEPALTLFSAIEEPADPKRVYLYLGNCHLGLGHGADAAPYFTLAAGPGQPDYGQEAQWYLALAQLRAGNIDECKTTLYQVDPKSAYAADAKQLLAKLQ